MKGAVPGTASLLLTTQPQNCPKNCARSEVFTRTGRLSEVWGWRKGHSSCTSSLFHAPDTSFPPRRQSYLLSSPGVHLGLQRPCCGMAPSLFPVTPLLIQGPSWLPWHPGHGSANTAPHCPGGCSCLALPSKSGLPTSRAITHVRCTINTC